jgi:primary-amine oxidase
MQAAFWMTDQEQYGTRVGEHVMGSLHTHAMNYKVDMDVVGTKNSILDTKIVTETVKLPWFDDLVKQKKMERTFWKTESEGLQTSLVSATEPHLYNIVNKATKNKWDNYRGYRLVAMNSPVALGTTVVSYITRHVN